MNTPEAIDDLRWLIGDEGRAWLTRMDPAAEATPALVVALRRDLSAGRVRLLLDQVALRRRAADKFSHPEQMFFAARALEQATDEWIAVYKSARFTAGPVYDLCCGIGGDLRALAERGTATAVDRDEALTILAAANAPTTRMIVDDVNMLLTTLGALEPEAAWHIDPDRRAQGRRVTAAAHYEPAPEFIDRLLQRAPRGAVKLAPAARWPAAWNDQAEFEWISRGGECRQLVAWFGGLSGTPGLRRATIIARRGGLVNSLIGAPDLPPLAHELGAFVHEPDAAVLAAGLTNVLCERLALTAVTPGGGYLTGAARVDDPALDTFEVLEQLPFDQKRLKQALRAGNYDAREIKKRDVDIEPEKLRQQLRGTGGEPVTVILANWQGQTVALITRRCRHEAAGA
ncbi:MAG: hypothetical protein JSS27_01700 [Planctomycetes bacterium]|nr:hypothetical protein [Planctomycetota bacterium]